MISITRATHSVSGDRRRGGRVSVRGPISITVSGLTGRVGWLVLGGLGRKQGVVNLAIGITLDNTTCTFSGLCSCTIPPGVGISYKREILIPFNENGVSGLTVIFRYRRTRSCRLGSLVSLVSRTPILDSRVLGVYRCVRGAIFYAHCSTISTVLPANLGRGLVGCCSTGLSFTRCKLLGTSRGRVCSFLGHGNRGDRSSVVTLFRVGPSLLGRVARESTLVGGDRAGRGISSTARG